MFARLMELAPTLKKHVGIVHTAAPLTLVQRKSFSVLVYNAYPELLTKREHSIPVRTLTELIGWTESNNIPLLQAALLELISMPIQWVDAENKRWSATTYLSYVEISGGECRYQMADFLARQLYNPAVYARISMDTLRGFKTRYGLTLYENCARYRPNGDFRGGTPEWDVDVFRQLMGVADTPLYQTFKELNRRIIKPAVEEVNAVSEIVLEARFKKAGKVIKSLAFSVKDNSQLQLNFEFPNTGGLEHSLVVDVYDRYGVPRMLALQWLESHGEERFREVIRMTDELVAQGKAKAPVGFMRRAFEQGYLAPADTIEEKKKLKAQRKEAKKKSEHSIRVAAALAETAAKSEHEKHLRLANAARTRFDRLPEDEQNVILQTISESSTLFRERLAKSGVKGLGLLESLLTSYLCEIWDITG